MSEDLSVITKETMENFIKSNEQFLTCIKSWMWERAESLDWKSLNHFQALSHQFLNEAILLAQGELNAMRRTH